MRPARSDQHQPLRCGSEDPLKQILTRGAGGVSGGAEDVARYLAQRIRGQGSIGSGAAFAAALQVVAGVAPSRPRQTRPMTSWWSACT
jgi:hypothetical protein